MQLLHLPDVAQSDMLSLLHPSELFILAMCSKKTARALRKNLRLRQPEIWVENIGNPLTFAATTRTQGEANSWRNISFYVRSGKHQIKILSLEDMDSLWYYECSRQNQVCVVDEKMFEFECILDYSQPVNIRICHQSDLHSFIPRFTKIHNFLCEIFKAPAETYLILHPPQSRFVPSGSVSRCDFTKKCSIIETEMMDGFWKVHPNQLCIIDAIKNFPFSTSNYEHFKNINNILVKRSKNNAVVVFLSFEGKHLVLEDGIIHSFYLREILEKWMKREGGYLKSVIIELHESCSIDKTALLEGITTEKCEKGTLFHYDSVIRQYHNFPHGAFDCTDGLDITRKTDGRRATVKVTKDYFMFLVW